jgi:hypothetical protein
MAISIKKSEAIRRMHICAAYIHKNIKMSNFTAFTVPADRISSLSFATAASETIFTANFICLK